MPTVRTEFIQGRNETDEDFVMRVSEGVMQRQDAGWVEDHSAWGKDRRKYVAWFSRP